MDGPETIQIRSILDEHVDGQGELVELILLFIKVHCWHQRFNLGDKLFWQYHWYHVSYMIYYECYDFKVWNRYGYVKDVYVYFRQYQSHRPRSWSVCYDLTYGELPDFQQELTYFVKTNSQVRGGSYDFIPSSIY